MKLYIKYMVSIRCKLLVKEILQSMDVLYLSINLGEVELSTNLTKEQNELFKTSLSTYGLELIDDKKSILIERIKAVIVEMIHYSDDIPKTNFSTFLSEKLQYDYTYLSNLFSETEGTTIEHYIILHKIEKVKELLMYDELNLTEIAWKLHYSSVAHLSNQFKKTTGLTPSFFKSLKVKKRQTLENL